MRRLTVLFVVLAALSGLIDIPATAQDATPEAAGEASLSVAGSARTDARYVFPFGVDGLNAELTVSATVQGVCSERSLLTTGRPDAWECLGDDDQIYDPCFENPLAPDDQLAELACLATPYASDVVVLTLEEPLVHQKEAQAASGPGTGAYPWAMELAHGERCLLSSEVEFVLAGEAVHYVCADGGLILGDVDRTLPMWTARFLAGGALTSTIADVVIAWY